MCTLCVDVTNPDWVLIILSGTDSNLYLNYDLNCFHFEV
jgi:hypothetical protein